MKNRFSWSVSRAKFMHSQTRVKSRCAATVDARRRGQTVSICDRPIISSFILIERNIASPRRQPITLFPIDHPHSRHFATCFRLPYFCFVNCLPRPLPAYRPPTTWTGPSTHVSLTSLTLSQDRSFLSHSLLPVSSRFFLIPPRTIFKRAIELTCLNRESFVLRSFTAIIALISLTE